MFVFYLGFKCDCTAHATNVLLYCAVLYLVLLLPQCFNYRPAQYRAQHISSSYQR